MRLRLEDDTFYYPNVMVACEPLESENPAFQREPGLLVEVISQSTKTVDYRDESSAWQRGDVVNEGRLSLPTGVRAFRGKGLRGTVAPASQVVYRSRAEQSFSASARS